MRFLTLRAYLKLIGFEGLLARGDFAALYRKVGRWPITAPLESENPVQRVCMAVDMACIWYWKEVFCLQRSAVTACMLRDHGVTARLIIGAQQLPFKAHAWVEVDGQVVNDKPYMRELYMVLDGC